MTNVTKIIFILIVLTGILLRFWNLGYVPISPDWDEVALGFNAKSVLETGHDEYGKFLPVVLRSFDDYKPALYMYLIIPFLYLFDLSVLAVRAPAAVFGTIGFITTFFLVRELTKKDSISLLAMGLLAISPWAIQFSRVAFEAQTAAVFNILTVFFFIKGLKKGYFLSFAAIISVLSVYLYQSEKVFMPLLLLLLVGVYWKELFAVSKKYLFLAAIIGVLTALPMLSYIVTNKAALTRATSTVAFSDTSEFLKNNVKRLSYDNEINNVVGKVFDNRRVDYTKTIIAGYLTHFDPNWLFVKGDLARHHAPRMALLYLWELPFLLIGIYILLFDRTFSKKTKYLIFGWLLLAPIPASVTSGVPHAVRTLNFLPIFQILTAIGLYAAYQYVQNLSLSRVLKRAGYACFGVVVSFFFVFYLNQYFVQQNYYYSREWQYGWEQLVPYVHSIEGNYEKIIVTKKEPLDQSHMFFLFYLDYPPKKYLEETRNTSGGFREHHYVGKMEFRPFDYEKEKGSGILFVGRPVDIPDTARILKTVSYLNGEVAIVVAE